MTTWQSITVFDAVTPGVAEDDNRKYRRTMTIFRPPGGISIAFAPNIVPVGRKTYPFLLDGRTEITNFRTFISTTAKGRYGRFWIPTYTRDFRLTSNALISDTTLTVSLCDYTAKLFSLGQFRRHIWLRRADGQVAFRKITASSAGASTETLTLDAATGLACTVADTMISFLLLVRLDSDELEYRWFSPNLCEIDLDVVELPLEYP